MMGHYTIRARDSRLPGLTLKGFALICHAVAGLSVEHARSRVPLVVGVHREAVLAGSFAKATLLAHESASTESARSGI
ncbi:hypothetical protein EA462_00075 [Natrarchaeobius halalkaliphilus]|uniref:Uncharacterized protein n=1 Tax=Natrarchaeobius halalkaliphilus TaxID=1679091 RepID=A0A3N6MB39_9EURY|nr:hypothetical protein EA462_00075 [Natrarchaeobius halalkaliphilus]